MKAKGELADILCVSINDCFVMVLHWSIGPYVPFISLQFQLAVLMYQLVYNNTRETGAGLDGMMCYRSPKTLRGITTDIRTELALAELWCIYNTIEQWITQLDRMLGAKHTTLMARQRCLCEGVIESHLGTQLMSN